jgi:hypothetical protein
MLYTHPTGTQDTARRNVQKMPNAAKRIFSARERNIFKSSLTKISFGAIYGSMCFLEFRI